MFYLCLVEDESDSVVREAAGDGVPGEAVASVAVCGQCGQVHSPQRQLLTRPKHGNFTSNGKI